MGRPGLQRDGTDLTVPAAIPTGNIVSYFGNGTAIEGVKTKGAGGNCQIYVRDGTGVKVRKNWLQVYMLRDVPHNGIVIHRTTGFCCDENMFDLSQSAYVATQKNQGIQLPMTKPTIRSADRCGATNFGSPPSMNISSFIRVGAPSGNRLFAGLVIENNTLGGFLAPSSGALSMTASWSKTRSSLGAGCQQRP